MSCCEWTKQFGERFDRFGYANLEGVDFSEVLLAEVASDCDSECDRLFEDYKNGDEAFRSLVDMVLVYICGCSMPTLISKVLGETSS